VKSFLDIYAQLVSKLIDPNSTISGFKEGIVDDQKMKGGGLIKWLTKSAPSTFTNASILASIIRNNSSLWVEEVVNWRNKLIHHGQIPNMRPMMVLLQCEPHKVEDHQVILPQMPNTKDVATYCNETRNNLFRFIRETLVLLPDINFDLVDFSTINK
jgi:hypothetical protein